MGHALESTQDQSVAKPRLALALKLAWIASLLSIGIGLGTGVEILKGAGSLFALVYIFLIIWWLVPRPKPGDGPVFSPILNIPSSYWAMLGLVSLLAIFVFVWAGLVMGNGWLMFPLSTLFAIAILLRLRKQINRNVILTAVAIAVALLVVELVFQFSNATGGIINALPLTLFTAFQAAAGICLLNHTGLSKFHLYDGNLRKALQSLAWGCMLAVPPALLNIASLSSNYLSEFDRQFDRWWEAFYALQPGILEETWVRLFLFTLFYALLLPTSSGKPQRALTAALLISVFIHGLAHYPQSLSNPVSAIFAALMYGIPLGLIYIRRDFEAAIAYHFFIDFVRFAFTVSLVN